MSAVVCFSGGLDSTVSLYWAKQQYKDPLALFFNYGQKAYVSERKAVQHYARLLKVKTLEVDLSFIKSLSSSALNSETALIPSGTEVNIEDQEASFKSAQAVWVPNRNGLFINTAAMIAEAQGRNKVVVGFNLEEAQTFPDNSKDFIESINQSLHYSTQNRVQVVSPTLFLGKKEIVDMGKRLHLDFKNLWPCYKSGDVICGQCESCKRYLRAIGASR